MCTRSEDRNSLHQKAQPPNWYGFGRKPSLSGFSLCAWLKGRRSERIFPNSTGKYRNCTDTQKMGRVSKQYTNRQHLRRSLRAPVANTDAISGWRNAKEGIPARRDFCTLAWLLRESGWVVGRTVCIIPWPASRASWAWACGRKSEQGLPAWPSPCNFGLHALNQHCWPVVHLHVPSRHSP